jgi:uncharacterized membrane protein YidH (DUF202 family)
MEDNKLMAAAQLIFAEKRTALALMRTGISVLALPLGVTSVLIATSKLYKASDILHLIIPVMVINVVLVLFGSYLVIRSIKKIRHEERMISHLKKNHPDLVPYFD